MRWLGTVSGRWCGGLALFAQRAAIRHDRDAAAIAVTKPTKLAPSNFPSSSFTDAESSSLPKKCSSAPAVPSEPPGTRRDPLPRASRAFWGRLRP